MIPLLQPEHPLRGSSTSSPFASSSSSSTTTTTTALNGQSNVHLPPPTSSLPSSLPKNPTVAASTGVDCSSLPKPLEGENFDRGAGNKRHGHCTPIPLTLLCSGDGLGFQMIRREAQGVFPLFFTNIPSPPARNLQEEDPFRNVQHTSQRVAADGSRTEENHPRRRKGSKRSNKPQGRRGRAEHEQHAATTRILMCDSCGETDTPQWRRGQHGLGLLCNPCGLVWGKQRDRQLGSALDEYLPCRTCSRASQCGAAQMSSRD
ncbi:hypothetical protein N3K66_007691 [Trichothecium roseum]|uniref:Uncharacterized protein n=1 Tax=Trichothecium roseum TaxID=47278 RepID=A0ACC0UUQ4_9HYPO|nr:hypothetical protein N3K66_007691 [Trichothecium roseum]